MRHVFRYLVAEPPREGETVALSEEDSRHLTRVVRRGPGDRLELTDGAGRLWPATVVATGPPATVRVEAPRPAPAPAPVVLYQGLIEGNRLDLVVEKAAELGIARVVLVRTARGRRAPAPEAAARRLERLRRLAGAAARQAGHGHLLEVEGLVPFGEALDEVRPAGGYLIDARGELALTDALGRGPASPAALFVGPEAGFSEDELGAARAAGLAACRLGPVTLRAETAALVAMSLALGAAGRFAEAGRACLIRFSVRFLGCKASQADASLIRDALIDAGHREAAPEAAEVHVVNTCALTLEAERKSRQQVNRGARLGRTFVSGCAVNLDAGQFAAEGVTVLPGSADRAAREIVDLLGGGRGAACADDAPRPPGRTRAFLKVQNGCDSDCSFCIIPTTRGRAESRPLARILADARRRIGEGHPELVITGINVGTYRDPGSGADLADLVRAVGRMEGLLRLRVSSIEPGSVDGRLLAALAETPTAAPHLHVPLQSGDDGVLRAMRRRYRAAEYREAALRARAALPELNLTTDAIVGFPGESEDAFAATAAMAEELRMSKVHVFSYSPRPGTDAAASPDAVTSEEKRERSRRLRDLSDRLGFAHRLGRVGGRDEVLLERRLEDGTLTGLGADYCRFVLPAGAGEPGDLVPVAVAGLAGEHLEGRPL